MDEIALIQNNIYEVLLYLCSCKGFNGYYDNN